MNGSPRGWWWMAARVRVVFEPYGVAVEVPVGSSLLEAARAAGVPVQAQCGGRGACGLCRVRVVSGRLTPPTSVEARLLGQLVGEGFRLACQARVLGDVVVEVLGIVAGVGGAWRPPSRLDPLGSGLGAALDLGSSKLVLHLVELETGRLVYWEVCPNPQSVYGADVVSRVRYALSGGYERLRRVLLSTVEAMIARGASRCGARLSDVSVVVVSGNSVVVHTFLGASLEGFSRAPYGPSTRREVVADARSLGLQLDATVYVPPHLGGFVGPDTVSSIVALDLDLDGGAWLLADLGTNTELALGYGDTIYVASAPAGPALEGHVSCGVRACPGAITRVLRADPDEVDYVVLGSGPPAGLTGPALLDLVALLHRSGVLDDHGRIVGRGTRVQTRGGRRVYVVAEKPRPLLLSEEDIAQLRLALAAVRAAVRYLLEASGATRLDRVFMVGDLGTTLTRETAQHLALLPPHHEYIRAGNTSVMGARKMLLSRESWRRATRLPVRVRHVELAREERYQRLFTRMLRLVPKS